MKLFFISNIRLPTEKAHGIQIMKTCEALAGQGIEVELIAPQRLNRLKDDPFEFYSVERNFKITKLWCLDLISLKIFGAIGFWFESWIFYLSIKKYLKTNYADVYYTRDLPIAYWLSKEISPVYDEIHTLPDSISLIYKKTWKRCRGLVVINQILKGELIINGVAENKILVARDAVDPGQFYIKDSKEECRKKLNLILDQKIVVYTGHLYEWKGTRILADAVKLLPKDIHIYLVGGTYEDIKKYQSKYKSENLHIVGWQKHGRIPYWLAAADVLVLPTSAKEKIGALYTSPMKLFEYMMAKRPIVASDTSSLREVLDDSTSYFFKPDDTASFILILKKIFASPIEAETKAVKAYKEVIIKYNWDKRAETIKNFLCQQF